MKRFIRVLVAIVLVAILLSELGSCAFNMFGPQDDDVISTVGEVVSVEPQWLGYLNDEEHQRWACYYIYVRPVGKGNNEELLLFTANCDTEMVSEFGADRSKIPELQVGAVVEITHEYKMERYNNRHPDDVKRHYVKGYEALSLNLYEGEFQRRQRVLQKNEDYPFFTVLGTSRYEEDTPGINVSYSAKITYPMPGYIVYTGEDYTPYWISITQRMDSATRRALESGAVEYPLWVYTTRDVPFDNLNAYPCVFVSASHKDEFDTQAYKGYYLDEFAGEKRILVRSDSRIGENLYYYVKLYSGEVKVSYSDDYEGEFASLCSVTAEGGVVGNMVENYSFSGETYISFESVGDIPAKGEIIVSFTPLEKLWWLDASE